MTARQSRGLNRRDLLRNGALAVSFGAVLAACGANRSGPEAPGRVGDELLPDTTPPDTTIDDSALLRTLQSLEYTTIEMHTRLLAMDALGDSTALVERFVADHREDAKQFDSLVAHAGGSSFACPNAFLMDRAVEPILTAVEGSDDIERDGLAVVQAFESWLGASYQAIVPRITDISLCPAVMIIGNRACRHAAVMALVTNPDPLYPTLKGEAAPTEGEFPTPYAIPGTFGQLTPVEVVVGVPAGEEQKRYTTLLQTPAGNSFVYNDLTC